MKRAKLEADLFVPHDISGTPYDAAVQPKASSAVASVKKVPSAAHHNTNTVRS